MKQIRVADAQLAVVEQGQGNPLLLVHGFPLDHSMWSEQIASLSDEFRVIAPDLRGFGQSGSAAGAASMEQFADDLAALLDALAVTQRIAFCGLSMGGYIAWQFYKRHADRLAKLILCDTRAVADSAEAAQQREALAQRVLAEGSTIVADAMIGKLFAERTLREKPQLVENVQGVMAAAPRQGVAAALRAMAGREDFTPLLPQIDTPALVVCGRHDQISTVDEMTGIARSLPSAELAVIEEAGHMAPLEQPQAANRAIRAFLRR